MKSTRLLWLFALLLGLVVLRVVAPPRSSTSPDIALATPRADRAAVAVANAQPDALPLGDARVEQEPDRPGNAFQVRAQKLPPVVPVIAPKPLPVPVVPAPPPMPAPPPPAATPVVQPAPPFQVIGTWDDGGARGVFVTTPQGALLIREGTALLAEYNVVRITTTDVQLLHVASNRELQLPIPNVSPTVRRP